MNAYIGYINIHEHLVTEFILSSIMLNAIQTIKKKAQAFLEFTPFVTQENRFLMTTGVISKGRRLKHGVNTQYEWLFEIM